jgi:hypothetical protein
MKIELETGTYGLSFVYEYGNRNGVEVPVTTTVKMYPVDRPDLFVSGMSELSAGDNPDKAVGRLVAVKRLFVKLNPAQRKAVGHALNKAGVKLKKPV